MAKRTLPPDPGLEEIDNLDRLIVRGRIELLKWNHIPAEEVERERVKVIELAKAVCDQLRVEYRDRLRRQRESLGHESR